jgi:hypothetical protein
MSRPYNRNAAVECKNKSDTSNNRGKTKHLKIIEKISEQHSWKARNRETKKQKQ